MGEPMALLSLLVAPAVKVTTRGSKRRGGTPQPRALLITSMGPESFCGERFQRPMVDPVGGGPSRCGSDTVVWVNI